MELQKRYTKPAIRDLTRFFTDNNNVERLWTRVVKFNQGKRLNSTQAGAAQCHMHMSVCENNSGYTWLSEVDEVYRLASLATPARTVRQSVRDRETRRKQQAEYIAIRIMRKVRIDKRAGKKNEGGWRQGYKTDSAAAYKRSDDGIDSSAKKRPKRKAPGNGDIPRCTKCKAGHFTRYCRFVMVAPTTPLGINVKLREAIELLSSVDE